jgi:hypothetical protein
MSETKTELLDEGEQILAEMEALQSEGPPTPALWESVCRLKAKLEEVLDHLMAGWIAGDLTPGEKFRVNVMLAGMDGMLGEEGK